MFLKVSHKCCPFILFRQLISSHQHLLLLVTNDPLSCLWSWNCHELRLDVWFLDSLLTTLQSLDLIKACLEHFHCVLRVEFHKIVPYNLWFHSLLNLVSWNKHGLVIVVGWAWHDWFTCLVHHDNQILLLKDPFVEFRMAWVRNL